MKKSKAKRASEAVAAKRLRLMRQRAVTGRVPYTVEEVVALQICKSSQLDEHISKIFPLILQLASDGHSIRYIEENLGFSANLLKRFLCRHKSLNAHVQAARDVQTDDKALRDYPS